MFIEVMPSRTRRRRGTCSFVCRGSNISSNASATKLFSGPCACKSWAPFEAMAEDFEHVKVEEEEVEGTGLEEGAYPEPEEPQDCVGSLAPPELPGLPPHLR